MKKIIIYHNQQCSKSRECLTFFGGKNHEIEVVEYLKNPLSREEIVKIIQILNIPPAEIIRKNEPLWKEFKDKNLSEEALIDLLVKYPKLIQRPIVIHGEKGIIARPIEKLYEWLQGL